MISEWPVERSAPMKSSIDRIGILDAAQALFEEQGSAALSFRRIATRSGFSATTPYRYFPSKRHVLAGLRIRAFDAIRETLTSAADSEEGAAAQLRAIASAYIDFAQQRPETYALLYHVDDQPDANADLDTAKRAALDVCRRAIANAEAHDELHLRTDALTAAHLFWAAVHGVVSLHLSGQMVMGRTLDEIAPELISTLVRGLSHLDGDA